MGTSYFGPDEYELRISQAQKAMVQSGLDCLMISNERNFCYFTGFQGGVQVARPRFVFIPASGLPVVLVAPNFETVIREVSPFPDVRLYSAMGTLAVTEVMAILRELIGSSGKVGVELGYEQRLGTSVCDFLRLRDASPTYSWDDAAELLWGLRMVKTPSELATMRKCIETANVVFPLAFAAIRPGMTEVEISRLFVDLLRVHGADGGNAAVVSGKGHYFRSMAPPRSRRVESGEMVWVDLSAEVAGYRCDFSRAAILGVPTAEQLALQRAIHEVTTTAVESVRPDVVAADVSAVCDREMTSRGLSFNTGALRYGHGLGLDNEPPHLAAYDRTTLRPGMVITVEPATHTEFGRFNIEENLFITSGGHEVVTQVQWELFEV